MIKFFKKYHKWLGIILTLFILIFSISGIILNHRQLFSGIDVNRNYLPQEYRYNNWNNAAVKGTEKIGNDSILIYGNVGIWLTDSLFSDFSDFNTGFPTGIDNRKISKVFYTKEGNLFAGTLFGLFSFDFEKKHWQKINLPIKKQRVTDITEKTDTLLVLTRSELLKTSDFKKFTVQILPAHKNYDNKVSLFKTLWLIHSGEIWGISGKLVVDFIALIFIFLSITGLIYFIAPSVIKRKKRKKKQYEKIKKLNKWSLKWHNKIGWITVIFLIITTITGMFLRPPLLIPIANKKVSKIPFSVFCTPNTWHDKLRRIIYEPENNRFIIAINEAIYFSDDNFASSLQRFENQPPVSIMGVNVFQKMQNDNIIVGSFSGLFEWDIKNGRVKNYITKSEYNAPINRGSPFGNNVVAGFSNSYFANDLYFDFNFGAVGIFGNSIPKMPETIKNQKMSLWNLALEFHTARMYKIIFGNFYILLIPLFGLLILFILISGFIVWFKRHR